MDTGAAFDILLQWVATEHGAVAAILCVTNALFGWLFWLERRDRREAWKARNRDQQQVVTVLNDQKTLLEVIKTLLQSASRNV